jgi:hypothetical protein
MKESTDIWFISFLHIKGFKIESFKKIGHNRVTCSFNIDDEMWNTLKLEFNNSEVWKYKLTLNMVKDLGF